jgi:hypothetical protein
MKLFSENISEDPFLFFFNVGSSGTYSQFGKELHVNTNYVPQLFFDGECVP